MIRFWWQSWIQIATLVRHALVEVSTVPMLLVFVCNSVKRSTDLMEFSLLDFKMNYTCDSMNFIHLT